MLYKINFYVLIFLTLFVCGFGKFVLAEDITITTYYPSPYGIYEELRSVRMAIGEGYVNQGSAFVIPDDSLLVENKIRISSPTNVTYLNYDSNPSFSEESLQIYDGAIKMNYYTTGSDLDARSTFLGYGNLHIKSWNSIIGGGASFKSLSWTGTTFELVNRNRNINYSISMKLLGDTSVDGGSGPLLAVKKTPPTGVESFKPRTYIMPRKLWVNVAGSNADGLSFLSQLAVNGSAAFGPNYYLKPTQTGAGFPDYGLIVEYPAGFGIDEPQEQLHVSGNSITSEYRGTGYYSQIKSQSNATGSLQSISLRYPAPGPGGRPKFATIRLAAESISDSEEVFVEVERFSGSGLPAGVRSVMFPDKLWVAAYLQTFHYDNSDHPHAFEVWTGTSLLNGNVGIKIGTDLNDSLEVNGNVHIHGDDDANRASGASPIDLAIDDNDSGIDCPEDGRIDFWTDYQRRMVINGSNVGIGYTAPQRALHVNGQIRIENTDARLDIWDTTDTRDRWRIQNWNGDLHFFNYRNETLYPLMIRGDNARVGIGTSSPANKLHVTGSIRANSTVYSSDKRWKKNVNKIKDSISLLRAIEGVTFNWRYDEFPDKGFDKMVNYGVVAQNIETVIPELVEVDVEGYKTVDYNGLIPILIEAVKEQQVQIMKLNKEIEHLKMQN